MSLLSRVKEAAMSRLVEASVAAITVLLAWIASIIGPAVWPILSQVVPADVFLPLLLLSLLLNGILVVLLVSATRKPAPEFQLRYGIYWDSNNNPHCPACQKPVHYDEWAMDGWGYYCKPCNKVTPLKDATGKTFKPEQVLGQSSQQQSQSKAISND